MTAGHKHREIKVRPGTRVYRVLRKPLLHTRATGWVDRSRLVFGVCLARSHAKHPDCWTLSLLGACHGLFGLTIRTPAEDEA